MKKIISLFLSIVMLISTIACVDLSAYAGDVNIENRAEWLSKLVETFDMTVESDNYPDNYFSDLTEESEYYRDVLIATEYGIINVEAGDPIYPEDELTREFAAQTLNACLNFQLEENEDGDYDYTFDDIEDCSFPYDDQIAVNRQWFELVDNKFCPNDVVKSTEITTMLNDANAQIEITTVDENYDSTIEVADGVVEIPNGTELTIDENNTITVTDCPVSIKKGDNFTAYFYGLPNAYVAESVTVEGNKTIIETQEANTEDVFEDIDIQEVSQINDAEFIPADGITVETDVQPLSTFSHSRESTPVNSLNNLKIGGDLTVDGWKIALSAKISNPVLETNITSNKTYVALKTDIDLSYSINAKTSNKLNQTNKTSKIIPVGYINIFGVGFFKVSFEISLSGGITIKEKFNITMGESYADGENLRIITDFTHKNFSIAVDTSVKAGFKIELGVSIATVKADIYASIGFSAKGTVTGYPNSIPSSCLNISGYMYLDIGAELTINYFFNSLHFEVEKALIDSKNSPVKVAFHFEDGNKVHECTRGKTPKYLTPSDSKYSNSADDYAENYENVDSSSFRYSGWNKNVTITKYTGNSSVVVIPEYIDGYKVTSIGHEAFSDCTSLTSVTIPDSVTSIGYDAFYNCTSLTSVTIPNSVTSIGSGAFSGCTSLTSVRIGNGIKSIEEFVFADCTSLTSVTIPNSVTSIGSEAFRNCTSLTSVTIPDSVTSIGSYAFNDCTSLTSVTIPDSVTSIGRYVFYNCTSLTSVTIPNSITSIGSSAFSGCTSLTSVTIPDSVTSIGSYAFSGCTSLTSVTIPDSVTIIDSFVFYNCTSLASVTIPDSVTRIYEHAFYNCKKLTSVTIPNSVTSIGYDAFYNCTSLTSVTIPNSVTSIGSGAFSGCTSLTNVTIPDSVTSIDSSAFGYCTSLTSVTIGNSVTKIGDWAFNNCKSLTSVTIPDSVTKIGDWAFNDCTSLTSITIPNSVTSIGSSAFDKVNNIVYNGSASGSPWGAKSVNGYVDGYLVYKDSTKKELLGCSAQAVTVTIPDSVTSIGNSAFEYCKSLTCVTIPNSVTSICDWAFYECPKIKYVFYSGSQNEWKNISIGGYNFPLTSAKIHYKSTGDHTWDNGTITKQPTCVGTGIKTYTCTVCDETKEETINATGVHTWNSGTVTKQPTCVGTGEKTYSCTNCTATKTEKVNATGAHTYSARVTQEATCTVNGVRTYTCSACDDSYTEMITATGHSYTNEVIPPTCTTQGYTKHTCSKCDYSYNDNYTQQVDHNYTSRITQEATCTVNGVKTYTCSACNDSYTETIYAAGHNYSSRVTQEATCTVNGVRTYTCSVCNDSYTETIAATGHSYSSEVISPTCTAKGYTKHTCSVCGDEYNDNYVNATAHSNKVTVSKATVSKNGSVVSKCSKCGKSTTQVIYYPKTISLSATSYTYDGKVKTPSVKVVGSNGKAISSSNYTVSYASGRKNVGKYAVKITFKGNYSGSKTLYFTINPKGTSLSKVTSAKKGFKVYWKKQSTQTTGYQIQYSTSSKFTNAKTVTVSKNSTTSKSISKLSAKKKYYVRIRTYKKLGNTNYYSSWSKAKYVTTKK